jgi:hypothetical protein
MAEFCRDLWGRIKILLNIVICMCDCRRGFGLAIGFIDHFVTTPNYRTIADLHISQVTRAKSFPARYVFTSSCLVTAPTMAIPVLPGSSPL